MEKSKRGFASMSPEKQREIASKGGKSAQQQGKGHQFTSKEASKAARKGHRLGTAHTFTLEEARAAGRKGAAARIASIRSKAQASVTATESQSPDGAHGGVGTDGQDHRTVEASDTTGVATA